VGLRLAWVAPAARVSKLIGTAPFKRIDAIKDHAYVYAAAQQYGEFLEKGTPISSDLPRTLGPLVSGLKLGNQLLVRRIDLGDLPDPVTISIGKTQVPVPHAPGRRQILSPPQEEGTACHFENAECPHFARLSRSGAPWCWV
jgi:hypothetical protein